MSAAAATDPIDLDTAIERLSGRPVSTRTTSPDLLGQLRQARQTRVKRIVCIGIDPDDQCDLLAETRRTRGDDIAAGLKLLERWLGARALRIESHSIATAYPNLVPAMLVRRLCRKRLSAGALPTEAGVLIVDVITAANLPCLAGWGRGASSGPLSPCGRGLGRGVESVENPFMLEEPLLPPPPPRGGGEELPVIIDDHLLQRRYRATAGASATVADILAQLNISADNAALRHGPLAAEAAVDLSTPIGRTDLWLHLLPPAPLVSAACTRCGECAAACPVRIHPAALLEAAQTRNATMARRFHAEACIACGLCTAVCPSNLPVMAGVIAARTLASTASAARPTA